ncbi:MAG: pyridoxamine 5'-phosphate oxidase [Caulobacterales bacterium]
MARDKLIPASPSDDEYEREQRGEKIAPLTGDDPFALFADWFAQATAKEPNDPNAMALASVDEHGVPDVRMVLLKDFDARGFTFYTNFESAKGRQLLGQQQAALCFHWKSTRRQVRIRGPVAVVSDAEADAYFSSRARDAQIGAWASDQSRETSGPLALEVRVAQYAAKFGLGTIPRPPHWSGFRVQPLSIEFWRSRAFRLHDRLVFSRDGLDQPWRTARLYP